MESDQFMPEYWPANRIIGKLEKALVKAENILGLIQSEQIANLAAAKVTGLLTSAQIEEIAAAKIGGKLTSAQIESIEAAKVTGKLTNAQIESLEAAKLTGLIVETQIGPESITTAKIKAANVTTAKLAASAITAAKIAANAITAEKIEANAVTAEKINALSVTTAKLAAEAVTVEKLAANSVTAAKIVAGTITAEKLSVVTLSAISVNAGTITAGTFKGTIFETAEEGLRINNEGVNFFVSEEASPSSRRKIEWRSGATTVGEVYFKLTGANTRTLIQNKGLVTGFGSSIIEVIASGKENQNSSLFIFSGTGAGAVRSLSYNPGGVTKLVFEEPGEKSDFIQYPTALEAEHLKRVLVTGAVSEAGVVTRGVGFTAEKTGVGTYTVTLKKELTNEGIMVATASQFNRSARVAEATKKVFKLAFVDMTEVAGNTAFHFMIFG